MISKVTLCKKIGQLAIMSMLYEVSATPKPGLVDRNNQGAHKDMDFFTFMASSASLSYFFFNCAEKGIEYTDKDPEELFQALRDMGKEAEQVMFEATGGINTHKGLIFSLGIICAAASCCIMERGSAGQEPHIICSKVSLMAKGLCIRDLASMKETDALTHGERLYIKYGIKGIRGEVENGFPTVMNYALPTLKKLKAARKYTDNDIFVQTLLCIMEVNEDTNIAARCSMEVLEDVKQYARRIMTVGGALTYDGMKMIYNMDRDFIRRNISPGGSADLLAVTIMFYLLAEMSIF